MSVEPGSLLGHFEILSPIGAGGMGEVYKARDTRLDRTVAIKVLPEHLSGDRELRARFEREAKAISQLNHPHICTLHDVGAEGDGSYIVMEYVEGETLAARLEKGPLPLVEAIDYGRQIADALDKAHRAGVVHRDIKPGNVMVTKSGVKLLDFGLARIRPVTDAGAASEMPTLENDLTSEGTILGTLRYMAPEQLESKPVDARADVWALGALLYEMVTGRRAFDGESQASLITAIMSATPPVVSSVRPLSPRLLDRVVGTCLAKRPDDRWDTAGDVGRQLAWVAHESAATPSPSATGRGRGGWVAAFAFALVAMGVALWTATRPTPAPRVTRLVVDLPAGHRLVDGFHPIALSPDGSRLVYTAADDDEGRPGLFVHSLDRFEAEPVADTEGATEPFFAPDGSRVGFLAGRALRWISLETGAGGSIADEVSTFRGATWGPDDTIVFSDLNVGLRRVAAHGGEVTALTVPDDRGLHRFPCFEPSGQSVLFSVGFGEGQSLAAVSVETGEWRLLGAEGAGAGTLPGHLVFAKEGTLHTVPFDVQRLAITGDPVPVVRDVYTVRAFNQANYSVAPEGSLAFVAGHSEAELVWVDRAGRVSPLEVSVESPGFPSLAADGRRLAVSSGRLSGGSDVWILDLARGTRTRLVDEGNSFRSLWSPDGKRLYFDWDESGAWQMAWKSSDGTGSASIIASGVPASFAPDGTLAFQGQAESWVLPPSGEARLMWADEAPQWGPLFSPDGKWVAFVSDVSGRDEVYVRSYPEGDRTVVVSTAGGVEPLWSRDGRELFYREGGRMMATAVTPGPAFEVGVPRVLFSGSYTLASSTSGSLMRGIANYDVSPDGSRFLMVRAVPASVPRRIHVVRNWLAELSSR